MRAVILAAGKSSRFWPLNYVHKSLLYIAGKPLLLHTIESLPEQVDEVIVVQSKRREAERELKRFKIEREVKFRVQREPRGMWEAVLIGAEGAEEDFLVIGPYYAFPEVLEKFFAGGYEILASRVENAKEYGVLEVKNEFAIGLEEKPEKPKSNLAIKQVYKLSPDFLDLLEKIGEEKWQETEYVFEIALDVYMKKRPMKVLEAQVPSLKYPWHFLDFLEIFSKKLRRFVSERARIEDGAKIVGNVFVEEGAVIFENAVIKGPAYIGRNAVIGNFALVRQSFIEENCIVGAHSEVTRSSLQPNVHVHASFIGDSVIGRNSRIGWGCVTANRRLDRASIHCTVKGVKLDTGKNSLGIFTGENVRTGVNAMFMPGTMLGSNSLIGPGTIVKGRVEESEVIYAVQELRRKGNG